MITSANNQFGIGQACVHQLERLNHEFEPFVGSPLAEREDAVLRIASPGKIRIFRPSRQNAVRSNVNIVATILLVQNPAIPWHQNGNRIRQQQHSGGKGSRHPISTRVFHSCILQIHGIHEVV
jgi:hypothetical protein